VSSNVAGSSNNVRGKMSSCVEKLAFPGRWVLGAAGICVLGIAALTVPAAAQRIENGTAVFAALDKVTARISKLEIKLGETREFGALKVTPRACYTRAPTEPPKTTSFVEVDETGLDGAQKRIFSGWMFAESPGLNAVEHPVFDVWLTECSQPTRSGVAQKGAPATAGDKGQAPAASGDQLPPDDGFRRRPRR
jgi:hypothetical protein